MVGGFAWGLTDVLAGRFSCESAKLGADTKTGGGVEEKDDCKGVDVVVLG